MPDPTGTAAPEFAPGEPVMAVLGSSYDLRDVPASFVCIAGICLDGDLRARVKLEDGSVQDLELRRLYRPVNS